MTFVVGGRTHEDDAALADECPVVDQARAQQAIGACCRATQRSAKRPPCPSGGGSRHTDCRVVSNHRAARRTILVELHLDAAHARQPAQPLCARAERVHALRRTWSRPGCASRHQRGCSWCRLRGGAGIEPASLRCDRGAVHAHLARRSRSPRRSGPGCSPGPPPPRWAR